MKSIPLANFEILSRFDKFSYWNWSGNKMIVYWIVDKRHIWTCWFEVEPHVIINSICLLSKNIDSLTTDSFLRAEAKEMRNYYENDKIEIRIWNVETKIDDE